MIIVNFFRLKTNIHKIINIAELMYRCNECILNFSSSETLKKHFQNKHQERCILKFKNNSNPLNCNPIYFDNELSVMSNEINFENNDIIFHLNPNVENESIHITENLELELNNLAVSRNKETKIINIIKDYTRLLKLKSNLDFEEPDWNYLFNIKLRIKKKFESLNIELPKTYFLDEIGKYTLHKLNLKDLLKIYCNKDLLELVENYRVFCIKNKKKGHYFSIYDGKILNEHEFFKAYPDGLKICLYLDDIKISGKKRLLIYFFLADLDPMIRFDFNHYLLWATCDSNVLHDLGFDPIFEILLDELLDFVDGIQISDGKILRGYLFGITGDNEILNTLAGITTCFQKIYTSCRRCYQKVNKNTTEMFYERSKYQTIEYLKLKISRMVSLSGITKDSWLNYISEFSPEKQLIPDISHDIHGGEIPRQLFSTISALIKDKILSLDQYNQTWDYICQELNLKRFLTLSSDIKMNQLFYENNENNYKNTFKFYESYIRLVTFPLILLLIVGDKKIFNHLQVHRIMCFKVFFHLLMRRNHTEESLLALEQSYNTVLENNLRCGYKAVFKTHSPKHYKTHIKELGTLRNFMTNGGENANQMNKNYNFSTRNVCYNLLINFIIKFKPYSSKEKKNDVKLSKFTLIDTKNYKNLVPYIGEPKCRLYNYFMLYGVKVSSGSCLKMNDSSYIVVRSIFQNITTNDIFIYGQICKSVAFDETLLYRFYSELGEHKLYPLNSIEQIVYCYNHKEKTYMIISFDRFLMKNAMLDVNE